MKTDLIVLKTRLLKNYKELEKNSEKICDWIDAVDLWFLHYPLKRRGLKNLVNAHFHHLELIIHE